mgnify:CR=1 FL=1
MVRGTFGNIRLRNMLLASVGEEIKPGGYTYDFLAMKPTTIYEASRDYIANGTPLVVIGGKEYGTGSSRDWAAKGTAMPFRPSDSADSPSGNCSGSTPMPMRLERWMRSKLSTMTALTPSIAVPFAAQSREEPVPYSLSKTEFEAVVRIDTPGEADYYRNGGILQYVLRNLMSE